ncbi:MAG: hypothetical protein ACK5HY_02415 [Parahaliea sp.]
MPLKSIVPTLSMAGLLAAAPAALAHSGHDHGHWSSVAIHSLTLLALAGVVGVVIRTVRNRQSREFQPPEPKGE